ncbi:DUF805 domain-containing protein [Selenomonadales bacterium OttesenSCG-928-I06]|nr:DUF805 domain-containing protein [Selenomonadales bacterium OttesenSCG-928-I06]
MKAKISKFRPNVVISKQDMKNKFFSCEGRLNRKPYIIRIIILWLLSFIISSILYTTMQEQGIILAFVLTLPLTLASISLGIRRLHDLNYRGWWLVGLLALCCIPVVQVLAIIPVLLLLCVRGTKGANKFGQDPLAE